MCLPYKNVGHAGGKTVYYYMQRFSEEPDLEVKMVCKVFQGDSIHINSIKNEIIPVSMPKSIIKKAMAYSISINSKFNPFYKYGNTLTTYIYYQIKKQLVNLKKKGYTPDVILLEWTEIVLFVERIKEVFPNARIVASEHDVKFQSIYRKYVKEHNILKKIVKKIQYKNMKARELKALEMADLVVTQSNKDQRLLIENGINQGNQLVISPFFMKSEHKWIDRNTNNVVIYGDMSRFENFECAIWFIENVLPKLKEERINLIVLGGKPPEILKDYESDSVHVTGFVDDVFSYLDKAFCMVVPLQFGAGIKVKCLEALNYGIPLVTNEIGIEGIDAEDGKDYIQCNSPEEFAVAIMKLHKDRTMRVKLSDNARLYAKNNLDIEESYHKYAEKIREIISKK